MWGREFADNTAPPLPEHNTTVMKLTKRQTIELYELITAYEIRLKSEYSDFTNKIIDLNIKPLDWEIKYYQDKFTLINNLKPIFD
jgi:hypothetical protein